MLKLLILITVAPLISSFPQQILINEVMTKNVSTFYDYNGSTPDWIELFNSNENAYNLSSHFITDDIDNLSKWQFPNIEIETNEHFLLLASGKDTKQVVKTWETIIGMNQAWRYKVGSPAITADWISVDYVDYNWSLGLPGFGFGDDDDRTIIQNANSVYLRTRFTISELSKISAAILHLDYDDGFVAYLNGNEISRSNLGTPGTFVSYNTFADENHEAVIYSGGSPEYFVLNDINELLIDGDNYLCIQVHNTSSSSSDLSAIPFFSIGLMEDNPTAINPPEVLTFPSLYLHTNFSLSSSGENIYLVNPDLIVVDSIVVPKLSAGVSYGRTQSEPFDFAFFITPTPGEPNYNEGFNNLLESPTVNLNSGFYNSGITIELSSKDETEIFYTFDGSPPTQYSEKYEIPISLQETTVLRAIAYKEGSIPSNDIIETYFINESSELPTISIITDPKNLWDYNEGIYVLGPNAESNIPYFGANFWQDWEKEGFIQFYDRNLSLSFESYAGLKIFGGWSRATPQKSLSIHARQKYGNAKFNYKFFPDLEYSNFESIILRNSGNDWFFTMFRDGMMQTLVTSLGLDFQRYRPSILFLNGEYWGIHNIREKINEDYLEMHHNVPAEEIDLLENEGNILEGTNQHYTQMINFINSNDMSITSNYEVVKRMMDIDNFISYMTSQIYFDNTDWPGNNIKFWRHNSSAGKWRWILFDTEFGFGIYQWDAYRNNTLAFALEENGPGWPNPPWSTFLLRSLLRNAQFKSDFINRYADLSNTIFKSSYVISVIDSIQQLLSTEIVRHSDKWQTFNFSKWLSNIRVMKNFASLRNGYLKLYYMNQFNIDGVYQLSTKINIPESGWIQINTISVHDTSWTGDYFIGNEIVIIPHEKPGYKFLRWEGTNSSNDTLYVNSNNNIVVKAIFTEAEYTSSIVINEINYNSAPFSDSEDWIELYNSTDEAIDISNWLMKDSQDSSGFVFSPGTNINANEYLIVCRDSTAFRTVYNSHHQVSGNFNFGLNNSGDQVRIFNSQGLLIDEVSYDDNAPWPKESDGTGKTLSLKHPLMDNSLAESWSASTIILGTPGKTNDNLITKVKDDQNELFEFSLSQNYPNPFNVESTIKYSVPSQMSNEIDQSFVSLEIYDMLGSLIKTIVSGHQAPGNYSVKWNANTFASGIYFYRLNIGSYQKIMKAVLLK